MKVGLQRGSDLSWGGCSIALPHKAVKQRLQQHSARHSFCVLQQVPTAAQAVSSSANMHRLLSYPELSGSPAMHSSCATCSRLQAVTGQQVT